MGDFASNCSGHDEKNVVVRSREADVREVVGGVAESNFSVNREGVM